MADWRFQNRRANALRWLEAFRRPIGTGCIIETEKEYKQYLGAVYFILLDIQEKNERIKNSNAWRCSFIGAKEKSKYTIYDKIGDTYYWSSYTNKLSELCAILKLRYEVRKTNNVEPLVLRGDPRFVEYGKGCSYEHYISDKHCQMLGEEIVTCMILADARRIDFYHSSNEYIRSHSYEEILSLYKEEVKSEDKEPIPDKIITSRDGDEIDTGYETVEKNKYIALMYNAMETFNNIFRELLIVLVYLIAALLVSAILIIILSIVNDRAEYMRLFENSAAPHPYDIKWGFKRLLSQLKHDEFFCAEDEDSIYSTIIVFSLMLFFPTYLYGKGSKKKINSRR